jgi:hypothetical protein
MRRRLVSASLALATAALICGASNAQTRYDYGGGTTYASGDEGFLVFIEVGVANPRNTDNIVAAAGPNVIIPEWDDEFAGRLGFGYRFAGGNKIVVSFWGFEADQSEAGTGSFEFPIGPTNGFDFDVTTDIEARSAEAAWVIPHGLSDAVSVDWSIGLQFAGFEETTDGEYDTTSGLLDVAKSLEGTMVGARGAGRLTYRRGSLSASGGVGLSMLSGEIEASSSLMTQAGAPVTTPLMLSDDSRSGTILDLDLRGAWHNSNDDMSVWIGWEQQVWQDIVADLARNLPDSEVISRGRDSVTFSWFKAGVSYRF